MLSQLSGVWKSITINIRNTNTIVTFINPLYIPTPSSKSQPSNSNVFFGFSSALRPLVGEGCGQMCGRLVRLICCPIILTANRPGRLLICRSLAIRLLVLPPLPSDRMRSSLLLDLVPNGGTDPFGMFPIFLRRTADVMAPSS